MRFPIAILDNVAERSSDATIRAVVEACATVGEISDAMRRVFGEYKEAVVV